MCNCTNKQYRAAKHDTQILGTNTQILDLTGMFGFSIQNNSENATLTIDERIQIPAGESWGPACNNLPVPFEGKVSVQFDLAATGSKQAFVSSVRGIECNTCK